MLGLFAGQDVPVLDRYRWEGCLLRWELAGKLGRRKCGVGRTRQAEMDGGDGQAGLEGQQSMAAVMGDGSRGIEKESGGSWSGVESVK